MVKVRKSTANRSSTKLRLLKTIHRSARSPINHILDLPNEILLNIFAGAPVWHHQNIRAACTRFKQISDSVVIVNFVRTNENPLHGKYFQVIEQATWAYRAAEKAPSFAGCLGTLLRQPFSVDALQRFLLRFYRLTERSVSDRWCRQMYAATFVGFLNVYMIFFLFIEFILIDDNRRSCRVNVRLLPPRVQWPLVERTF